VFLQSTTGQLTGAALQSKARDTARLFAGRLALLYFAVLLAVAVIVRLSVARGVLRVGIRKLLAPDEFGCTDDL
jgi:hypothetical protein